MDERDRFWRSAMEWWKTVYDSYKQFQTISLASIAVFGALLGGPFKETFAANGDPAAQFVAITVLLFFLLSSVIAVLGMSMARRNVLRMGDVTNQEELAGLRGREASKTVSSRRIWTTVWSLYLFGIGAFILFLLVRPS